ncbi:hypothetical protein B0A55_13006, partial [Friedmanniomyces simplex]
MANYNGTTTLKSDCGALTYVGYTSVRPEGPTSEPLVWQAGRATSAAPGLFTPLVLPGLGTFQDEKDAEHRYFRLNVQFGGQEPRLDDIGAMEKLSQDVNLSKNDQQLTEIKLALLASSFFFELKRAPKFDASGFYICQGEIR